MRENRTYGSVRGGQSNLIPSTRLTAAMPLRVVEGASKFIEDAGLYKTFTTALRAKEIPLWWLVPPPFRPAGKRVTGFSVAYGSLRIKFPCHPVGSMLLDSRVAYSSPMNPVPLPPPQAGALWVLSHGVMSLQESIETYSAP